MKLLFRQQPSFIFRFYVTNQNNELFYIIKRKMAIMYQLYIYDAHENIVAKIEENPGSAVFLFIFLPVVLFVHTVFLFIKMRNILVL